MPKFILIFLLFLLSTPTFAGNGSGGTTFGMFSRVSFNMANELRNIKVQNLLDQLGLYDLDARDVKVKVYGINPDTGLLELDLKTKSEVFEIEVGPEQIEI